MAAVTVLAWFLSEAGLPVALGLAVALALDVARHGPLPGRHHRIKNWIFMRRVRVIELRSRAGVRGGSGEERTAALTPARRSWPGFEPPPAPPAPLPLAGTAVPQRAVPARTQRRRVAL